MRNLILSAALVSASLFGMTAQAADVPLEAGKTYVELSNAVPVAVPGKIEVVELFWYGCPHCFAFEPTINPWVEKLPADVNFVRIPAMFGGIWDVHGQLFLTLEAMGVEDKVHKAVFETIHKASLNDKSGNLLKTPEEMAEFLAAQGVDKAKAYQISGVPTMVVDGKYRFDLGTAGGPEQALNVADQLIAKERAAK